MPCLPAIGRLTFAAAASVWGRLVCTDQQICEVGRVAADPYADITIFDRTTGHAWVVPSTGTQLGQAVQWDLGPVCIGNEIPGLVDLDGDGFPDAICKDPSDTSLNPGEAWVSYNAEGRNFTTPRQEVDLSTQAGISVISDAAVATDANTAAIQPFEDNQTSPCNTDSRIIENTAWVQGFFEGLKRNEQHSNNPNSQTIAGYQNVIDQMNTIKIAAEGAFTGTDGCGTIYDVLATVEDAHQVGYQTAVQPQ